MREYLVKAVKVGDSVVVALPRELLAAEHVSEGMMLKITVQKANVDSATSRRGVFCDEDDPWKALE